ncbi:hypothetical protein [uncultured Lactobacillus sp.]|uniref:hypothetical protein n=1 Tax=uncultured Lactobacillus sp. TaxID=153152 RepID=UPI002616EC33|nr:hypothetical protein [uncultured Lactobacillus sp.]
MENDITKSIENYKKSKLYTIFHSFQKPEDEEETLYIQPRYNEEDSQKINHAMKKEDATLKNKEMESNNITETNLNVPTQTQYPVTDKTPQNNTYSSNKQPKVNTKTSDNEYNETSNYGGPKISENISIDIPSHESSVTIPTNFNSMQNNLAERKDSNLENQNSHQSDTNKHLKKDTVNPTLNTRIEKGKSNNKAFPSNLINQVIEQKEKTVEVDSYQAIKDAAKDINWIEKSQRLELAFKDDLAKIPLKKITVYSVKDNSESYIPLDSLLFNLLGSVAIGNSLYILFIFRNGKNISIAPEKWIKANREDCLKNGFQFFYKDLDLEKLISALKIMSVSITPTEEYTEFWLKYMPVI